MKHKSNRKWIVCIMTVLLAAGILLTGCGKSEASSAQKITVAATTPPKEQTNNAAVFEPVKVYVFAANSMSDAMADVIAKYNETQPNVSVSAVYDSSGTLLAQIEESGGCDIFLSAAQKQMDTLQNTDHLVTEGTRHNIVNNQLIVMTYKDSNTKVQGIKTLSKASSIAICAGSVPAGNYTRKALISLEILGQTDDSSLITTKQLSDALNKVEINECENVGAAAQAVSEASNEVATCYYSDYVKYSKQGFALKVIEKVDQKLTGDIIYPVCQVENSDAQELEKEASADFLKYMISDEAKAIYKEYGFDTDIAN